MRGSCSKALGWRPPNRAAANKRLCCKLQASSCKDQGDRPKRPHKYTTGLFGLWLSSMMYNIDSFLKMDSLSELVYHDFANHAIKVLWPWWGRSRRRSWGTCPCDLGIAEHPWWIIQICKRILPKGEWFHNVHA